MKEKKKTLPKWVIIIIFAVLLYGPKSFAWQIDYTNSGWTSGEVHIRLNNFEPYAWSNGLYHVYTKTLTMPFLEQADALGRIDLYAYPTLLPYYFEEDDWTRVLAKILGDVEDDEIHMECGRNQAAGAIVYDDCSGAPPLSMPTLTEWGIIVLTFLFMAAGVVTIVHKRRVITTR